MLKRLRIKDFALIDDIDISFFNGLNVLTGETGAGKTIILESLNLLFGKRSDAEMIRYGKTKAVVKGEFIVKKHLHDKYGEVISIEREIDQKGRHTIKLNDESITLAKLRELTKEIGMIHSQNESLSILDPQTYLSFIDLVNEKKINDLFNKYQIERNNYLELNKKLNDLKNKRTTSLEKKDFLEFQVAEIKKANLVIGEKEALTDSINKLSNFDKIKSGLTESYQLLNNEYFLIDNIYNAKKALDKIISYDEKYSSLSERLGNNYYELEDIISNLYSELKEFDFDEKEFNDQIERIKYIESLEKKYQKNTVELIEYLEKITEELLLLTDYDGYLQELQIKVDKYYEKALDAGKKLSRQRKENAHLLEKDIVKELGNLDLNKASFKIVFTESELLETGIDSVDFYISLNEGEIEKPLSKVASGGERSRFLFAIKALFASYNNLSILVLDEIDIGISGKTAAIVAKKMVELASNMQLIVITHLPQVAAKADHHFLITKEKKDNRMTSVIEELDGEKRVMAIALMLSDEKISNHAINQAKMMLEK